MIKKIISSSIVITLVMAGNSQAANFALLTTPPALLNLLSFLVAGACLLGCYKIYDLVRGGYLSKGWKIFVGGFSAFVLSQLSYFLNIFEIVALPDYLVPTLVLCSLGLFLYGIFEVRKVLS